MKPYCMILDKRYMPTIVVSYSKAIIMQIRGHKVLEYHPIEKIRTVSNEYKIPIVIQVDEFIDMSKFYVTPSRQLIFIRDGYVCQYCQKEVSQSTATIDHIVPKSQNGSWSWYNLVTCCPECNQKKGDSIWKPIRKPFRPEPFIITFKKICKEIDIYTYNIWFQYIPRYYKSSIRSIYKRFNLTEEDQRCHSI